MHQTNISAPAGRSIGLTRAQILRGFTRAEPTSCLCGDIEICVDIDYIEIDLYIYLNRLRSIHRFGLSRGCTAYAHIASRAADFAAAREAPGDYRSIDSPCECVHNHPDSLDARLFSSVVLAVAPAVAMDETSSLLRCPVRLSDSTSSFLYSKRRNSWSKLAHVYEQSEVAHSVYLVASGHLQRCLNPSRGSR